MYKVQKKLIIHGFELFQQISWILPLFNSLEFLLWNDLKKPISPQVGKHRWFKQYLVIFTWSILFIEFLCYTKTDRL